MIGISQSVSRFLPTGGSTRPLGLAFGPNTQIAQEWTTSGALAVTIRRNPTDEGIYYWRARTYDKIDLNGWDQTAPSSVDLPPDARILDQRADDVLPDGHHSFTFTVTPGEFRSTTILSPQTPINVDQPTRLTTVGSDGYFSTLDRVEGGGSYTVTALTPISGLGPGQVNIAALRATDTNYPDEIKALYSPLPDGSLGPNALQLKAKILDEAPSKAPIDLAEQIVKELKSPAYKYATDVRDLPCAGVSKVECFAHYKTGFCQYYASTMAVILRHLGVPTRIAQGFLPGSRDLNAATETVLFSNAHAWVEVYFPGYGWLPFDPTGSLSQLAPLPTGNATASASIRPLPEQLGFSQAGSHRSRSRQPRRRRVHRWSDRAGSAGCGSRAPVARRRDRRVRDLAARSSRRPDGRRGLRHGDTDRIALRLRATSEPDGLRVRGCPQRGPADRPPPSLRRSRARRSSRSTPARSSVTSGSRASRRPSAGCG